MQLHNSERLPVYLGKAANSISTEEELRRRDAEKKERFNRPIYRLRDKWDGAHALHALRVQDINSLLCVSVSRFFLCADEICYGPNCELGITSLALQEK